MTDFPTRELASGRRVSRENRRSSLENVLERNGIQDEAEYINEGTVLVRGWYYYAQSRKARKKGRKFMVPTRGVQDFVDRFLKPSIVADDPLVIGQKILSNAIRLHQNYGADYNALVLVGSRCQRIIENGHDKLSTWGLLKDDGKTAVRGWIEQLVNQKFLHKSKEFKVLQVTKAGESLLRGDVTPRLLKTL